MGKCTGAGLGQNVTRQMSIHAGLLNLHQPLLSTRFAWFRFEGSSWLLKQFSVAMQILSAGGAENMSQAPYVLSAKSLGRPYGRFKSGRYHD